MEQGTLIVLALAAVLVIAGVSVILLGRNAAKSSDAEQSVEIKTSLSGSAQAQEVESTTASAGVTTR